MARALTKDASGRYHYRSGPNKGQFAKKADIEAFRQVQAGNGRRGAAVTNARTARYTKAAQTISSQRGIPVSQAKSRIIDYLDDYYEAQARDDDLPDFAQVYRA